MINRIFILASIFIGIAISPVFAAKYRGNTIVYFERSHGLQVEYYSKTGRAYLWYPGNRSVVAGRWQIRKKGKICFQYGQRTYNPVTGKRGGRWECNRISSQQRAAKSFCNGDVFGLTSGKIPYKLNWRYSGLRRLKAKCGR